MPVEIEAKVKVREFEAIRSRLRRLKGRRLGQWIQTNRFFDDADKSLQAKDSGLRLRTNRPVRSGKMSHVLTFKGPRQTGKLKRRREIELDIANLAAAESLLKSLGFTRGLTFIKRRESWRLKRCHVELDQVPRLGKFVEIEGPDAASIQEVMRLLDLNDEKLIRDSYPQLLHQPARTLQRE